MWSLETLCPAGVNDDRFIWLFFSWNKKHLPKACNFIKKETRTLVFFYEFWEISKNTFFIEQLWVTVASDLNWVQVKSNQQTSAVTWIERLLH